MLKSIGGAFREVANGLQNSSRSNSISETTSEQIELTNRNSNGEANKTDGGEVDESADDATTTNGGTEGAEKSKKRDSDQTSWQDLGDQSGLELRDHSGSDFLVQPGRVIHLRRLSSQRPVAQPKHATAFTDIPLSTRMMTDHIPMVYESAILEICERMKAERMETMHEVANRFRRVTSVDLMNSPSRHHPTRGVLSPGSEFKRSVAKNKKEKQSMLANAAPRFGEEEEKERRQRMLFSSAAEKTTTSKTEETTQTSNSKGWQVVRNFFSTMMSDSPTGDYDKSPTRSDDENTLLDGDDPNDKDDKGQIVDEFHAAAASAAYNSAQR
jgi:chromatin remodeling complex protein RSC6